MLFHPCTLPGLIRIEPERRTDERGALARTFCATEFSRNGLNTVWPQANAVQTLRRGTLRGLHWQAEPHPEIKLIRCTRGRVWDVIVDVRPESPMFGRWEAFELTPENGVQLYVPGGFAHGFQCLSDDVEMAYLMSDFYVPDLARGLRWEDPRLAIPWPVPDPILSARDRDLPTLAEVFPGKG